MRIACCYYYYYYYYCYYYVCMYQLINFGAPVRGLQGSGSIL